MKHEKKEFFSQLLDILQSKDFATLLESFAHFYEDFKSHKIIINHAQDSVPCEEFSALNLCGSKSLSPRKIRRPKNASSLIANAKILHSVAHIESSAIVLALDAAYRFKNMPKEFYEDWLSVANEEISHFCLLNDILGEIGYKYGDFPTHNLLFDALQRTQHDVSTRMGIVHRGLEAKGLDANPFVQEKLLQSNLDIKPAIKRVFDTILRDEITHVSKGDKWWRFSLSQHYADSIQSTAKSNQAPLPFVELCAKFSDLRLLGKIPNLPARLSAGFNQAELQSLQTLYAKSLRKM